MVRFLVDVNLPKQIASWSGRDFIHVFDLNDEWTDSKIWEYAKMKNLTIITKDADFSDRIIATEPPPKVIHLKIGNMKMNDFHNFISNHWEIELTSEDYKLVNVYKNEIIAID